MPPETPDDITDDFGWLLEAAEHMNEYKPPETVRVPREHGGGSLPGNRPGDHFNRRGDWFDLLPRHGWKAVGRSGQTVYWRRPGKEHGWSATTGYCRTELRGDLLYVFTTSAPPFESEQAYSKFEALCFLEHDGDWEAACSALKGEGFGEAEGIDLNVRLAPAPPNGPVPIPTLSLGTGTEPKSPPGEGGPSGGARLGARSPTGWPLPILASELRRLDATDKWLWHGYLSRGGVTLLSALWKIGKTTLLAYLLRALERDGFFCGLAIKRSRVLVVSEEDESTWAERRDAVGLKDHLEFIPRPFRARPTLPEWRSFLAHLAGLARERKFDLVLFDTISKLWPVRDENEAPSVENALLPMYALTDESCAVLLVHHVRKGDGTEATASRGSGALPAFVETIVELRRFEAANRDDTRRVLSGYGRFRETPDELVVRWDRDGNAYESLEGNKHQVRVLALQEAVAAALPRTEPGVTQEQLLERVTGKTEEIKAALNAGADAGRWRRAGRGVKGSPYLYWRPFTEEQDREAERAPLAEVLTILAVRPPSTAADMAPFLQRPEDETRRLLGRLVAEGKVLFSGEPPRFYLATGGTER